MANWPPAPEIPAKSRKKADAKSSADENSRYGNVTKQEKAEKSSTISGPFLPVFPLHTQLADHGEAIPPQSTNQADKTAVSDPYWETWA